MDRLTELRARLVEMRDTWVPIFSEGDYRQGMTAGLNAAIVALDYAIATHMAQVHEDGTKVFGA
jgi:hypothetical protein